MIDYDKTIAKFFTDAIDWLNNRTPKDKDEQKRIADSKAAIQKIAVNPHKYLNPTLDYMRIQGLIDGFIQNDDNNTMWLAVSNVLKRTQELYYTQDNKWNADIEKQALLDAIKQFKFHASKNLLKDIVFTFRSPKSFAVHTTNTR